MASVTLIRDGVVIPPPSGVTLELTMAEAEALKAVLTDDSARPGYKVRTANVGIYSTIRELKAALHGV